MNGKLVRSILLVAAFFAFNMSPLASQAQPKWHTLKEGNEARIGTRLYFVDFYTSWCSYCKKMDRETFRDRTVAKILDTYYYPVKFDAESTAPVEWFGRTYNPGRGGRSAAHEFATGVRGYPTFVLYRSDGTLLQAIPGYYPARDFVVILWYFASGDCDRYPFERYQQIFDKEIRPQMNKALNL